MSFKALGLNQTLVEGVEAMGFVKPTPIQQKAIPEALAGRDIIGCAQTGTGKTAAFVLPALQILSDKKGIKALVVTPTRELADQIEDVAETVARFTGHSTAVIYGGVGYKPQEDALKRGVDFLVATPGRLLDMMRRKLVRLDNLEIFILDEADRMLDMGFWPDVQKIVHALPLKRQNMLFSATMSPKVLDVIGNTLTDPVHIEIGHRSKPVAAVDQSVYPVDAMQKPDLLIEMLKRIGMDKVLVFTGTKKRADILYRVLHRKNIAVAVIHSDLTQSQRQETLADFKSGKKPVLIATDIVARGIDVELITHVINYDIPSSPEDYVHRIGRTARANAGGEAISLLSAEEHGNLLDIEATIGHKIAVRDLENFDYTDRFVPRSTTVPVLRKKTAFNSGARRSMRPRAPRR